MTFVKMLLSLSAGGALLGVFLMILRRVAGGKLSNRFFYYAWLLVLLRFILPVHGLMPVRASAPERVSVSVHNAEVTQQYAAPGVYNASPAQDAPAPAAEERTERKSIAKSADTADLLTAVWLCGGAAMLSDSQDVIFLGCAVSNCPDPQFTVQNCTGFSWEKKLMDRYAAFNVSE